jgi:hypothetical protein
MTSSERREARYHRRVAGREAKRETKLSSYDNFDCVANFDNLYKAYKKCLLGVSWKESVQRYEVNAMLNILETLEKLLAGESVHKGFVEFILHERGKDRHIKSVHISERVVQKCLCDEALVPILSNSLIYDNSATQKGNGTHFAIRRLICHLSKYYRANGRSNDGYALLVDFSKYFDSIDHSILFELLDEKIKDQRILELTKSFIRVFGGGKSLGLGSQVSQICAIFFPDKLDHFIKEKLRIKYYGRYMDDLYLIHADKEYLKQCLREIVLICDRLKIKVNIKKTRIVKLSQGMTFLKGKYILLSSGKILKRPEKESTKRMRRKLSKFKKLMENKKMSYGDIRTSYQSWRGNYKRRFHAYHRVRHMDNCYNDLFVNER